MSQAADHSDGMPVDAIGRRLVCESCGGEFMCLRDTDGACWCEAETYRLPMPLPADGGAFGDCLCLSCLRRIANNPRA